VGHSRGADRLRFAPEGTATVALGSVNGGINHPKDNTTDPTYDRTSGEEPNEYHYTLSPDMIQQLAALAAPGGEKEAQDPTTEIEQGGFGNPDEVDSADLALYKVTEEDKDQFAPDKPFDAKSVPAKVEDQEKDAEVDVKGTPEEPKSEEHAEAGNYRKGHCTIHGLNVTIENLKGQTRSGTDSDGKAWSSTMAAHYGYIKRTKSKADGDHIDVFVGPDEDSEVVFVVNQNRPGTKVFDEHKCMLGYTNEAAAKKGYLDNYDKGWKGLGSIVSMTIDQFKWWLDRADTSKPAKGDIFIKKSEGATGEKASGGELQPRTSGVTQESIQQAVAKYRQLSKDYTTSTPLLSYLESKTPSKKTPVGQSEKKAQLSGTAKALLGGLGLTGAGVGGGAYYLSRPYEGDPEVSRWSLMKTRRALDKALKRLGRGREDIEVQTGMHRKAIPLKSVNEAALKHLDYVPSLIAIPERGQQQLTSYRRRPDPKRPEFNPHIHKHQKNWFIHVDKHPSLTLALQEAKTPGGRIDALKRGLSHVFHEGIPGAALYLRNLISGRPTFEDFMKVPKAQRATFGEPGEMSLLTDPHKHASAPLRPGNTLVPMQVTSGQEKKAELTVEVVETSPNATKGLSYLPSLPDNYGMLFKSAKSFWMRGVNFDLDMVFMDKAGTVLEIQRMKAPRPGHIPLVSYEPTVKSAELSLEVPAGWCKKHQIKPGDQLLVRA
jgi:uncharacterized membrane protein (UPF0127 family)